MKQKASTLRNTMVMGIFDSQFGPIAVWLDQSGKLARLSFNIDDDLQHAQLTSVARDDSQVKFVADQVHQYEQGERVEFDLPLSLEGTPFQVKVWNELSKIPFGQTISYQTLATRVGNPKASRAVGRANGTNPISLIIPCHRVIGSNGSLTGYDGGLLVKERLLSFEKGTV